MALEVTCSRVLAGVVGAALACVAVALGVTGARAQQTPPLVVVRFLVAPDARRPSVARVTATAQLPGGRVVTRMLRAVAGACVVDVGGAESLAVVRCDQGRGRIRDFELMQVGRNVVVDEYETRGPDSERRRVRRLIMATARRGWAVVPRCAETYNDPRACPGA